MASQTQSAEGVQGHYGLGLVLVWSGYFLSAGLLSRLDIRNPLIDFFTLVLILL